MSIIYYFSAYHLLLSHAQFGAKDTFSDGMRLNSKSFDHGMYSYWFPKPIQYKRIHKQNLCVTDEKYAEVWVSILWIRQFCILVSLLYLIECESHNQERLTTNTIQNIQCSKRNVEKTTKKKKWQKKRWNTVYICLLHQPFVWEQHFRLEIHTYTHTHLSLFFHIALQFDWVCVNKEEICIRLNNNNGGVTFDKLST